MRQLADRIEFINTKLNSDVDLEKLPKGDSPVDPTSQNSGRANMIMEYGNLGALVLPKGMTQVNIGSPTGTTIIAKCEDIENNAIIYLIYHSGGSHSIRRHTYSGANVEIYDNSGIDLNFQSDEIIRTLFMIGSGDDTMLGWVSESNPPRLLNIARGIAGSYGASEDWISLAKDAPGALMTISDYHDTSIDINNIYNKGYQIAIKYIYFDGKESSWSDYSYPYFVVTNKHEAYNGEIVGAIFFANSIRISKSGIPDGVTKVKIAYRYTDIGSGVASAWYLYDTVDVSSNSITYDLQDNKTKSTIDPDEILILGNDVPLYGTDAIPINDNRIAISNPTIGYDSTDINISLSIGYCDITDASEYLSFHAAATTDVIANGANTDINLEQTIGDYQAPWSLVLFATGLAIGPSKNMVINMHGGAADYSYQAVKKASGWTGITVTRVSSNVINIANSSGASITIYSNYLIFPYKRKTQKAGATHYFGITYEDGKGRKDRCNISSDSQLFIPWWPDLNMPSTDDAHQLAIIYEISHNPPSWAETWELVYGGNNISAYYQLPMICNSDAAAVTADITYSGGYMFLDVNAADDRVLDKNNKFSTLITFDAQKGDRVRFKAKIGREDYPSASWKVSDLWTYFTENIDLEIVSVDENGVIKLDISVNQATGNELDDILGDGAYDIILVEVYRIDKEIDQENIIYQSIGQKGLVSGGYHQTTVETGAQDSWYKESDNLALTTRNQTAVQSCIGVISCNDFTYFINCYDMTNDAGDTEITNVIALLEIGSVSLSFNSKPQLGKINYVDPQHKQRTHRNVIWGGTYSEDGFIYDELNKFDESDVRDLDDKFGDAIAMVKDGYTLKVFQEKKITPIGIGVDELTNADGTTTLTAINSVLGQARSLKEDYGTLFPLSVEKHERNTYFYDIMAGKYLRNSPNGTEAISEYGMKKFWTDRSKDLLDSGLTYISVVSVYDKIHNMLLVTVVDSNTSANSFTLGFHEPTNTWISFYSFLPDLYVLLGENRIFAVTGVQLWEMYINSTRCNYFGSDYAPYFTVVSNSPEEKVFESVHVNSNQKWYSPENDDILIHSEGSTYTDAESYTRHKTKMQSRLKSGMFKFIEGLFKARYLRNLITRSSTPSQYDLYHGDVLRGRYLKQRFTTDSRGEVIVKDVTINSSISSGN